MTLQQLIFKQTKKRMPEFVKSKNNKKYWKFSYATLKSWSLPKHSKCGRLPEPENITKLAGVLGVSEEEIINVTHRGHDE